MSRESVRDALYVTFPASPESVRAARHTVGDFLASNGCSRRLVEDARLVVGEACANVVRHAYGGPGGAIELEVRLEDDTATVVVRDRGRGIHEGTAVERPGMGLRIMAQLADELRLVEPAGGGTEVRLTFACPTW